MTSSLVLTPRRSTAALAALALTMLASAAPAQLQRSEMGAVWCYDAARDAVSRTMREACRGQIISEEEAQRRSNARADRVRKAVESGEGGASGQAIPANPVAGASQGPPPGGGVPGRVGPTLPNDPTAGRIAKGQGTGFFVNPNGAVVTAAHVVRSCGLVTVVGFDQRVVTGRVRAFDNALDVAALDTGAAPPLVAKLSAAPTRSKPDLARIVGYSSRGRATVQATVTQAYVPSEQLTRGGRQLGFAAKAYPGHSGSPLLNQFGEVIGIVYAKANSPSAHKGAGRDMTDHGFAVSLAATREFLTKNNVSFTAASEERSFDEIQLLERARRFVVRVQCWS